jgi:ABC-type sugar transport system ATPase subunit
MPDPSNRRDSAALRAPALVGEQLWKSFGGVHALRGASLEVAAGEVHGLIGQNGSGKSTLIGILSGQRLADRGTVRVRGKVATFSSPAAALDAGVVVVTQETTLVPDLSVAENVLLGRRLVRTARGIDWTASNAIAADVLERLALDVQPTRLVRTLPIDQQQLVEIARAISMRAHTVILDEPTSALTEDQVDALFAVVRELRDDAISTIFVSHRLAEVFAVTDRITVLRDGVTVAAAPTAEFTEGSLIEAMVGHAITAPDADSVARVAVPEPVLRADRLCAADDLGPITLDVAPGETVGVAGLVGSGRGRLLHALAGYSQTTGGTLTFEGARVGDLSPVQAMERGIAFIPSDRKVDGLVLIASIGENLGMVRTAGRSRFARPTRDAAGPQAIVDAYRIKASSLDAPVSTLSGGNQQKVMLAKWLSCAPRLVLLDEPTRGVDVAAKAEIYRLIDEAKRQGCAVVVSSSENDELREVADRIIVMSHGRIVAELRPDEATDAAIAFHAMGSGSRAA